MNTPFAFVAAIMLAYRLRGMDPGPALDRAHIVPLGERQGKQQWPRTVEPRRFKRFCAIAMQELDDEAPGWFRRRLPWGSYGMLARACTSTTTVGHAIARWCRCHGLLTHDVQLALEVQGPRACIRLQENLRPEAPREFALLSLMRNIHGLACWWADSHIPLNGVGFPFPEPPHAGIYSQLFPGPTEFGIPVATMCFDAAYLQLPVRRTQADVDRMLRNALPLMVWPYRRDRLLVSRVRRLLRENPSHTAHSLADELAVSQRTLYRRLSAEGCRLQDLKDHQRRRQAEELLRRTRYPIKRIALELGFRSERTFARAFCRWTGQSPEQWRD